MDEKNIKLTLAYDGSHYHGWQRQKNGVTIQGVVEEKIEIMVGEPVKLIASGRTDAGVHAINQVCNFITRSKIGLEEMKRGLNSLLPDDIFVRDSEYVSLEFHARYKVKSKTYEYRILNREDPDLFLRHYVWHIRVPLNAKEMSKCLAVFTGRHDFSSFRSSGSGNLDPVRTVLRAELHGPGEGMLRVVIEAEGFLRHMVRNILGTLVDVGLGKMDVMRFKEILESKDRRMAGVKAPPQGLFLMNVEY
ncbi:MAG: tRNA pseudouridine(38-40) synthase TruA [Deltaproteobacteria bacterium]|nr:tRNA pseudouridine(38-40) synthase TruA [Deltaproteobacteria bacterium]MBW2343484.1 tRNA pseudouridine(38-40) synthase TruA [Deltaproteobacteria bacterium]